ncbi:MAG TPA: TauD/TfdA family dioxygenase [Bryobacteraceae bacterium]|nr:TauD/TfdA family dioxygenase [Bryobacteraceae bacterium]
MTRLAPMIGAEITGIDLSCPLDAETVRNVAQALALYGILVFPDQAISDEAHARFGKQFGELARFRASDSCDSAVPEIFRGANTDQNGNLLAPGDERLKLMKINWLWHIDSSYRAVPTRGAILHGLEMIDDAGDTIFANLRAAYEMLPTAERNHIEGLFARHSFEFMVNTCGLPALTGEEAAAIPAVLHPLVRQHRDGRKSLYLSPPYMETIAGWDQPASLALVQELTEWAAQDRFLYRHRWRRNDLIMWDNGWTMHKVTPFDIAGAKRITHGVVLVGSETIEPVWTGKRQES